MKFAIPALHDIVARLPPEATVRYRESASLQHFERVASELLEKTGQQALAQAGFFHGVSVAGLEALPSEWSRVRGLLTERERLRRLDDRLLAAGEDDPQQSRFRESVLAPIKHGGAVVLLLVDQLDHLDPQGDGRAWLQRVQRDPATAGPAPRLKLLAGRDDRERHLAFADTVVPFVAGHFGFAQERRWLRDLVALQRDAQAVDAIVATLSTLQRYTRAVSSMVEQIVRKPGSDFRSIRWTWRHVRQCQNDLGPDEKMWPSRAWRCGFCSIVTATPESAYRILRSLHEAGRAQHEAFRDYFSNRKNQSDYQALHTAITIPFESETVYLRARILTHDSGLYDQSADRMRQVAKWEHKIEPQAQEGLVVYTPDHDARYLPQGALVLNFAASLNSSWVASIDGAVINGRQHVGPLARLSHQDHVVLKRGGLKFLPKGWKDQVPESTRRGLTKSYSRTVGPLLEEAGRRAIMTELTRAKVEGIDDNQIDTLLEKAVTWGRANGSIGTLRTTHDYLRLVGSRSLDHLRATLDIPGAPLGKRGSLNDQQYCRLLQDIKRAAQRVPELDIPSELRQRVTDIIACATCGAPPEQPVIAVESEKLLTLHRPDCPEAANGFPVKVNHRLPTRQYVTIETTNRPGVLVEICTPLRKHHVDVIEIVGRRLSPSWAAVRLELDCPSGSFVRRLMQQFASISGVRNVFGPEDLIDPVLERGMPPRRDSKLLVTGTNPIVRNAPVTTDDQFYGRREELKTLTADLNVMAKGATPQRGKLMFVSGPLQTGKTSFALRILRETQVINDHPIVEVNIEARLDQPWTQLESRIVRALRESVSILGRRWPQRPAPSIVGEAIEEVVEGIIAWTKSGSTGHESGGVVIAIDEVLRVVEASRGEVARRMYGAVRALEDMPHCMVILAGPAVRTAEIDAHLRELLDSRAQLVRLRMFDSHEIGQLLRAEKLPAHRVIASEAVQHKVFDWTKGDPLWVGYLLHEMWDAGLQQRRGGRMKFAEADVDAAAERVADNEACFELRLRFLRTDRATKYKKLAFQILSALSIDARRWTLDAISTTTRQSTDDAAETLHVLDQAGLVRNVASRAFPEYEIASPLLAKYVTTPRSGRLPLEDR